LLLLAQNYMGTCGFSFSFYLPFLLQNGWFIFFSAGQHCVAGIAVDCFFL